MKKHVVRRGECLTSIAGANGFVDASVLLDHPDNAELMDRRAKDVLHPGDVVVVPDRRERVETRATGACHKFKRRAPEREIHVVLEDHEGEPIAGEAYTLTIGELVLEGTTDGDGKLSEKVPARAKQASLAVGSLSWELQIASLNPVANTNDDGATGAQGRLSNLGYDVGAIDGKLGERTITALRAFQVAHGLQETGELDEQTSSRLVQEHGS